MSKSPTTAPSTCARSSIKTHPPTANAWPLVSLRAYQGVPSPKSLAWAGPYASGRTPSWPTSTQPEPATHRQRLPQPHQPQTPNARHRRRPRRLHPHSTLKSQLPPQVAVWAARPYRHLSGPAVQVRASTPTYLAQLPQRRDTPPHQLAVSRPSQERSQPSSRHPCYDTTTMHRSRTRHNLPVSRRTSRHRATEHATRPRPVSRPRPRR